jgi:hypothetical protein
MVCDSTIHRVLVLVLSPISRKLMIRWSTAQNSKVHNNTILQDDIVIIIPYCIFTYAHKIEVHNSVLLR